MAGDPARAARRPSIARPAIAAQRAILGEARVNAALMLHVDGAVARDAVAAYLVEVGRSSPETAAKRLEFISHPLWRLYDYVYTEGEAMLRRWLDVGPAGRARRALRPPAHRVAHAARDPRRDGGGAGGAGSVRQARPRRAGSRSIRAASRTGSRRAARCDTSS